MDELSDFRSSFKTGGRRLHREEQLTRSLQVVAPFHLSPISNRGGCWPKDKTSLNRISCLYCATVARSRMFTSKKARVGSAGSQLRGLIVNCDQGQV